MRKATLQQLMIDEVPFPNGFKPIFCTKSQAEGFDGIWHAHDSEPSFKSGEWRSAGQVYEIGIDPSDGLDHTPAIAMDLRAENSVFKIVYEVVK
jgi:hypothetical protein